MRLPVAALVVAGALAGGSAGASPRPLFGIAGYPSSVVRLDAATLRPVGRRIATAGHTFGWSYAPNGSRAAGGSDGSGELRLYDLRGMRSLGDVHLGAQGLVLLSAWATPRLLLAAVATPGCCGLGETTVVGVDADERRVLWRRALHGSYQDGQRFRRSFVLVLGPRRSVGASRLAVVGPDGRVRTAALPDIRSGIRHSGGPDPATSRSEIWNPGLALDPRGRAFVVQHGAPVAEVDLRTLRVRVHGVRRGPLAAAKYDSGPTRVARWLGNGLLAVTGSDSVVRQDASGVLQQRDEPAGLKLVDTRRWTVRTLDAPTSRIEVAGRTLLAYGISWDSGRRGLAGDGLRGYDLDGSQRFHRYAGEPISTAVPLGPRLLVSGSEGSRLFRSAALLDTATGRELRRLRSIPAPLPGDERFFY